MSFVVNLIRGIAGYVDFKGKSEKPETFINLSVREGINIWNLKCKGENFSGSIIKSQYKKLRPIAFKSCSKVRVQKRHGLPFLLKKFKGRLGVIIGVFIFFLIISSMSQFIWVIQIKGNDTIEDSKIESALCEIGVKPGVLRSSIDAKVFQKEAMLRLPNLSFIAINLTGCVAEIEVSEKQEKPNKDDDNTPCNLVSSKAGQIVRYEVYQGQKVTKVGDAIEKGQMLVNGLVSDDLGGVAVTKAAGKVFALVREKVPIKVPLAKTEEYRTGKFVTMQKLNFFNLDIPLTLTAKPNEKCSLDKTSKNLYLFGTKLPISITTQQWNLLAESEMTFTTEEAKESAQEILRVIQSEMEDTKIISCEEHYKVENNMFILEADILSEQNIAVQSQFNPQEQEAPLPPREQIIYE